MYSCAAAAGDIRLAVRILSKLYLTSPQLASEKQLCLLQVTAHEARHVVVNVGMINMTKHNNEAISLHNICDFSYGLIIL